MAKDLKHLGTANAWGAWRPPEFLVCQEAGHKPEVDSRRRWCVVHTCRECEITWDHDESD